MQKPKNCDIIFYCEYVSVAQLDRVSDSDSEGRGFKSRRAYHSKQRKHVGFQKEEPLRKRAVLCFGDYLATVK